MKTNDKIAVAVMLAVIIGVAVVLKTSFNKGRAAVPSYKPLPGNSGPGQKETYNIKAIETTIAQTKTELAKLDALLPKPGRMSLTRNPFPSALPETAGNTSILKNAPETTADGLTLSGIIYDTRKPFAIINDEVKAEAESIAGCTVYKILPDRVILKQGKKTYTLKINGAGLNENETPVSVENNPQLAAIPSAAIDKPVFPSALTGTKTAKAGNSRKLIRTVQALSTDKEHLPEAVKFAKRMEDKGFTNVRIENIAGILTVRVGIFETYGDAEKVCLELKKYSPTSFARTAYQDYKNVVYRGNYT